MKKSPASRYSYPFTRRRSSMYSLYQYGLFSKPKPVNSDDRMLRKVPSFARLAKGSSSLMTRSYASVPLMTSLLISDWISDLSASAWLKVSATSSSSSTAVLRSCTASLIVPAVFCSPSRKQLELAMPAGARVADRMRNPFPLRSASPLVSISAVSDSVASLVSADVSSAEEDSVSGSVVPSGSPCVAVAEEGTSVV